MAQAIEQIAGMTVGHAALGFRGGVPGSVRHEVHDGDTIVVRTKGNFGVRFLGVDAPEISFTLPGDRRFTSLSDPRWETFLSNPFTPKFESELMKDLLKYLRARVGPGVARNHYEHAVAAEDALEQEILNDMAELGQTEETFDFFLVFAFEILDRYGRFLSFINCDQPDARKRPRTYNERLLMQGKISPYFIWPNIDPFFKMSSINDAVIEPGTAHDLAEKVSNLKIARQWVREARKQKIGIFDANNPLRLEPFEVRFLARQRPPDRWVIDLSLNDNLLINPEKYHTIPNAEDRLFIPAEYLPLFVEKGWRRRR